MKTSTYENFLLSLPIHKDAFVIDSDLPPNARTVQIRAEGYGISVDIPQNLVGKFSQREVAEFTTKACNVYLALLEVLNEKDDGHCKEWSIFKRTLKSLLEV